MRGRVALQVGELKHGWDCIGEVEEVLSARGRWAWEAQGDRVVSTLLEAEMAAGWLCGCMVVETESRPAEVGEGGVGTATGSSRRAGECTGQR